ncbi:MAG: aminotransferase class V-fold PLP-dependent enzyme [Gemmatimonadetes bacterium]|nr:aminotransferase class V-fold PLP-dependent enzyme [Gemmatimonadota bacterium]
MTPEEFRRMGHRLVDWVADYRARIGDRPVMARVDPGQVRDSLPEEPPESPEAWDDILEDIDRILLPGVTHWQHPRFFGYFPGNADLASVLGDVLSTGIGAVGVSWEAGPALTELEEVVTDWARRMFGLSDRWTGVIQDTASTSTLVALLCARERATDFSSEAAGMRATPAPLVVYASEQSHSSVTKAAKLAGFGQQGLRLIPCDDRYAMDPEALAAEMKKDRAAGAVPCAVVATSGTTGVTAFDPLEAIGALARERGAWFHVDAAMAGAGMVLPELEPLFEGVEQADSLVINAHKWLGAAFDCALYYVREPDPLLRVMSTSPSYLRTPADAQVRNLRDWGLPLGRRFRALKLWFLIREQGVEGLRRRLRRDMENARWLASQVQEADGWRVLAPVTLQTVCLRYEPPGVEGERLDAFTRAWARRINESGVAYLTSAALDSGWMVRVSIGAEATERTHVEALWAAMRREAEGEKSRTE